MDPFIFLTLTKIIDRNNFLIRTNFTVMIIISFFYYLLRVQIGVRFDFQ